MESNTQISSVYEQVNLHAQIEGANAHELIDLLYAGALDRLAKAKGHFLQNNYVDRGHEIGKVIGIISELQSALSDLPNNSISQDLMALYVYITELILASNADNDITKIDEAIFLIRHVRESWNLIPNEVRY